MGSPCHSWKVGSPCCRFQGLQPPKTVCWRSSSLLRFCVTRRRLQGALPTAVDRAEFVLDGAVLTLEERLSFNRSGVTMSHYEVEFGLTSASQKRRQQELHEGKLWRSFWRENLRTCTNAVLPYVVLTPRVMLQPSFSSGNQYCASKNMIGLASASANSMTIPVEISPTKRENLRPLQRGHFVTRQFLAPTENHFCREITLLCGWLCACKHKIAILRHHHFVHAHSGTCHFVDGKAAWVRAFCRLQTWSPYKLFAPTSPPLL